jgi:hypothetical protein
MVAEREAEHSGVTLARLIAAALPQMYEVCEMAAAETWPRGHRSKMTALARAVLSKVQEEAEKVREEAEKVV